jgi:P27 family predicted phage terminase small subunit
VTARRKPPSHLQAATKRWWQAVHEAYELEEHHARLLQMACEAWDQAQEARAALRKHGPTYNDRFGQPRSRPEVAIERDSRLAFCRILRELRLDIQPDDDPRPPDLNGGRLRHAS